MELDLATDTFMGKTMLELVLLRIFVSCYPLFWFVL